VSRCRRGGTISRHCWRRSLFHVKTARKKCIFNLLHRLFPEKTSGTALKPVHNRLFPKETAIASSSEEVWLDSRWSQITGPNSARRDASSHALACVLPCILVVISVYLRRTPSHIEFPLNYYDYMAHCQSHPCGSPVSLSNVLCTSSANIISSALVSHPHRTAWKPFVSCK
jgi:hypothetical protein